MRAVITGATKGIGRAIAERFIAEGIDLAICSRTEADLEDFKKNLLEKYPNREILIRATDMSKPKEVQAFGAFVAKAWDKIDVLVNNAGVFLPGELTDPSTEPAFVKMMDTNLYSTYYMTRSLLPQIQANGQGHIFNICSIASIQAYGTYSVSKFAMLGYSKVLREELKAQDIRVTAILPGATYTASWEGVDLPEERFMPAEDMGEAVWNCFALSKYTVVEEMVLRPQLGDI